MKVLMLTIFFVLMYQYSFSQSCIDTSFRKSYLSQNASLSNYQYYTDNNGIGLLAGNYINNSNSDTAMYLLKLSEVGNLLWAKKISLQNINFYSVIGILEFDNGDILLTVRDTYLENVFNLVKLNKNGDLIWAKNVVNGDKSIFTSDYRAYVYGNEIYVCYMSETNPSAFDQFSTAVIKLDTSGSLLWNKFYGYNYGCTASVPIGMTEANNNLIVFGRMFPLGCNSYVSTITESSYYGMKVDKQTGNLVKSIAYRNPIDFGNLLHGLGGNTFNFYAAITATANGQYYLSSMESATKEKFKIRFDSSLNVFDGYEYKTFGKDFFSGKIDVDLQGNTNIVYSNGYATQNLSQYVAKLDVNNNIIRQKKITAPANSFSYYGGFNPFARKENYMSIVTNIQTNATHYVQLYQLSNDEQNSDCYGTDTNFIKINPYPFTIDRSPFFDGDYDLPVTVNDIPNVVVSPINIIEEDVCTQISNCSFLKIMPTTNFICTPNQTFTAHKNGECYKHVFWQIDTAAIDSIAPMDDTTVFIRFKKTWRGSVYLYASVNSCMDLKDSFEIYGGFVSPDGINLGKDTFICNEEPIYLNARKGFENYLWQDGSTDSFFIARQPGKYFVTARDYCYNLYSDTINVTADTAAAIHLGNDTSICSNQPLLLNAGNNHKDYVWSTGDTTSSIIASKAGKYIVNAKDTSGCVETGNISILNVYPAPIISLDKKNIICKDQHDTLFAHSDASNYLWQDGSTNDFYKVKAAGKYMVTTISDNGCISSDSTFISAVIDPPANFLPADSFVCAGESIIIEPIKNYDQYLWSTGNVGKSIVIQQPGIYSLQVTDHDLCTGTDTINIALKNCEATFFVPNSFTPNNDGLNDIFKPIITGELLRYEFSIYNRYGQLIFRTSDVHQGWNGIFNAQQQNSGTFIWYCQYQFKNDAKKFAKGTVVLIK